LQEKKWIKPCGDCEGRKKEYIITSLGKEVAKKELVRLNELVEVAKLVLSAVENRQDRDFALMNIDLSEAAEIARTAIAKMRAQATTQTAKG
jgi:hypothetical protein